MARQRRTSTRTKHQQYLDDHGIVTGGSDTATIGFSKKEQKWYGWSHRAIYGFGVGAEVEKGSTIDSLPVGFKAKTLEDARRMAEAFSQAVS